MVRRAPGSAEGESLPVSASQDPGRSDAKLGREVSIKQAPPMVRRAPLSRQALRPPAPRSQNVPTAETSAGPGPEPGTLQRAPGRSELPLVEPSALPGSKVDNFQERPRPAPVATTHTLSAAQTATVQAAPEDAGAGAADAPGASADEQHVAGETPVVDLDTMARQVYQILRRRLRVEQERAGRGMG